MADDLEGFIRQQKAKIIQERHELNDSPQTARRKWDKNGYRPSGVNDRRPPQSPKHTGLPVGDHEQKRRNLQEERKREYNELLEKKMPQSPYHPAHKVRIETPEDGGSLPLGEQYTKNTQQALREERQRDMQIQMARTRPPRRLSNIAPEGVALQMGDSRDHRQRLYSERQLEMQEQMALNKNERNREYPISNGAVLPVGGYSQKQSQLRNERQNDMQEQMRKVPAPRRRAETPPDGGGLLLGEYENKKKILAEERRRETQIQMEKKKPGMRKNGYKENEPPAGDAAPSHVPGGLFSGLGAHDDKKKQLQEERRKEYNDKISQDRVRSTGAVDKTNDGYVSALPGMGKPKELNHEYDENTRDMEQDDGRQSHGRRRPPVDSLSDEEDEYGHYLRDRAPRKGWATPTYEEILERKRREERSYRRNDDIDAYQSPRDRDRVRDRDRDRDRESDRGGYRGRDRDWERRGRLGDINYMRNSISDGHLNQHFEEEDLRLRERDLDYERKKLALLSRAPESDPGLLSYRRERQQQDYRGPPAYYPSDEYDRRPARGREINYGRDTNRGGDTDRGRDTSRGHDIGHGRDKNRGPDTQRALPPPPPPQNQAADNSYNATLMIGGNVRSSADQRRKANYREELQRQMEESKAQKAREKMDNMKGPPGVHPFGNNPIRSPTHAPPPQYNPSQYDSGPRRLPQQPTSAPLDNDYRNLLPETRLNAQGLLPAQLDDPYNFYAQNNPLSGLDLGTPVSDILGMPNTGYGAPSQFEAPPGKSPKSVTFAAGNDEARINHGASRQKPSTGLAEFPFSDDNHKPDRSQKQNYQAELLAQMEETKRKKQAEKRKQQLYDQKMDEEIRNYDPFGRGGAGAPVKDRHGNIITDLKKMKAINDNALIPGVNKAQAELNTDSYQAEPSIGITGPSADLDASGGHARGGHGIFGEPMTAAQKKVKTTYQEELRMQMEERKRQQDLEKAKIQEEEAKIMQKIEEDNRKMQQELEDEKRKERAKQEEAQRQQEELRRQQEQRRRTEEEKQRAADERHQADAHRRFEEEKREREREKAAAEAPGAAPRGSSPPVPALKSKIKQQNAESRPNSKLSRKGSADVLQHLARMKQQLASEQKRVETDLKVGAFHRVEPTIFDPRLEQKSHLVNRQIDIFEVAQQRQPVSVRRGGGPEQSTLNEFNSLKNDHISQFGDNSNLFEDQSAGQSRNPSARDRRRQQKESSSNMTLASGATLDRVGSAISLDPQALARRNEERLRKLNELTTGGDDISVGDPDEILERFMAKQVHHRPPTGSTVVDETWMSPGPSISMM